MSFSEKNVSFKMFYLPGGIDPRDLKCFQNNVAPPLTILGDEPVHGWVTSRFLLDTDIKEETVVISGYLYLTLMKAERKIPTALLKAECKLEEIAQMQAEGKDFLSRKEKSAIKKEITARLLPKMPPMLTGIEMVYDSNENIVYAECTTDKQTDVFIHMFEQTTNKKLIPLTPESAAVKRANINIRDIPVCSFSPDVEEPAPEDFFGREFLTWVCYFCEKLSGIINLELSGEFGIMLDGPVTLVNTGVQGAHVTQLRNGLPLASSEATTALLGDKKIKQAKMIIARKDEVWETHFDADEFIFRSTKLPKGEQLAGESKFQERMLFTQGMTQVVLTLYDKFLEVRYDDEKWAKTLDDIHVWMKDRKAYK
jgi:hypothetical protein